MTQVVTGDYLAGMQVVNIKELKARLSSYIRQVRGGETFLVTDRSRVVARLGPVEQTAANEAPGLIAKLVALGARPPVRARRPTDYIRSEPTRRLTSQEIQAILDWARGDAASL